MTEAEWTRETNCYTLGQFLDDRFSDRKWRLFACACCRRSWHWIEGTPAARTVEVAEAFADGRATVTELEEARSAAWDTASRQYSVYTQTSSFPANLTHLHANACAEATRLPLPHPRTVSNYAINAALYAAITYASEVLNEHALNDDVWNGHRRAEDAAQADVLRDVFGNPFRAVSFDPMWRTTDVMLLAQGIYEERAFDRTPILADALQDAGCDSDDILDHLRDPRLAPRERPPAASGPAPVAHVRGCWALDLVLGKE